MGRLAISGLGRFGSLGLLAVLCLALVDELTGAISCGAVRRPRRPAAGPRSRPDTSTRATTTFRHGFKWHRARRAGVGAIVGAASRAGREHLQGSSPPDIHREPDSGRPRRSGPAPIRASEGLRAPVAMVVSPRPERAGQADQDGRPSGAALTAIDLSVVRGVGSSTVVRGSIGSYRPVIAGAKLREGTTRFCQEEERSRESDCLQCAFTPLAGNLKTTKTDKKHGSRRESHPLSDRPEFDWPCRT